MTIRLESLTYAGERRRGLLFDQGPLFETTINPKADRAEQEIRHPHHEVNASIVATGFAEWIVVLLRTGGSNRVRSERTSVQRARSDQQCDDHKHCQQPDRRTHLLLLSGDLRPPL